MNLAISHFAFDSYEEDEFFDSIQKIGFNNIEVVLQKIAPFKDLNEDIVYEYRQKLDKAGIKCIGLSGIFLDSPIKDFNQTTECFNHLTKVFDYAKILGAKSVVYSSPKMRKDWNFLKWFDLFTQCYTYLHTSDTQILIKPCAKMYGGEYFFNTFEIVKNLTFQPQWRRNVATMVCTHNLQMMDLNPNIDLVDNYDWIDYIHVSDFFMHSQKFTEDHLTFAGTLNKMKYNKFITYDVMKQDGMIDSIKNFYKYYSTVY